MSIPVQGNLLDYSKSFDISVTVRCFSRALVVILMIRFGGPEHTRRGDLRGDSVSFLLE